MRRALVACALWALLVLPCAAAEPEVLSVQAQPGDRPWWRRAHWQPRATVVHAVPIKRLHPEWCAAEPLERGRFEAAVGAAELDAALAGRRFLLEGSFDGSGAAQIAFVGAYRRCSDEHGLFAAIVEPAKQRMRMRFLVELPEPGSGLAALDREPDGTLAVWWCAADCANGSRIAFNREQREFYVAGPATRR
jgi:hypothetical protein